jgi:branched-chain amino acid transport system ATP-binding protein
MSHVALGLDALTKTYGGVTAVDRVDLHHDSGGVVGLIGPNGAGKTTLFNLVSGVVAPTSGRLVLDGRDATGLRADRMSHAGVARTFQNLQVFTSLTVAENVLVARERFMRAGPWGALLGQGRMRRAVRRQTERVHELVHDVGLDGDGDKPAASLPYGRQRRVEIARALACEPRLLLLDEPLAGLSRAESEDLLSLVRTVAASGVTVLLVEHDVSAVMEVSDRVVVLHHGQLLASGTPAEVQADDDVRAAYLGEDLDLGSAV